MLRRALLLSLVFAACTRAAEPPARQSPDTQGVEGHGGIAVVDPKAAAPTATPASTPAAADCGGKSAKELYLQAYVLKEDSPARAAALFRQVIDCTKPDDEYHQKALDRVRQLGQ